MATFLAGRRFLQRHEDVATEAIIDGLHGQQIPVYIAGFQASTEMGVATDLSDLPGCVQFTIGNNGTIELVTDGTDSLTGPVGLTLDDQCYVELPFVTDRYIVTDAYFTGYHLGRHGSDSEIKAVAGIVAPDTVTVNARIGSSERGTSTDYVVGKSGALGTATGLVGTNAVDEFYAVRGQSTDEIFLRLANTAAITTNIHAKIAAFGKSFEVILKPVPLENDRGGNAGTTQLFRGESDGVAFILERDAVVESGFGVDFYTL